MPGISRSIQRIPVVGAAWRKVQKQRWFHSLYEDVDLWRKYKRFRPEQLRLPDSGNVLFLDPRENRGRSVLRSLGRSHPMLRRAWHEAVERLQPTIVLDIGLNYGQFLFAEKYRPGTRLVGIEANEALRPWVERSRQAHPNADQLEVIFGLASDRDEEQRDFYVNHKWSGGSSVFPMEKAGVERRQLRSLTMDSLFKGQSLAQETLVFKIDVEGFEPVVLGGMQRLIRECGQSAGIIEFNQAYIQRLGVDPNEFLASLDTQFHLYLLDSGGHQPLRPVAAPTIDCLRQLTGDEQVVVDLLLVSDVSLISKIGLPCAGGPQAAADCLTMATQSN